MSDNTFMPIGIDLNTHTGAKLRVIGVGGGGGNAINNMISAGLSGVDFIAANTDSQALDHNLASIKIQMGKETTKGLGAGANPQVGEKAAEESLSEIKEVLRSSDMVFVTAGMGGGTGTGAAPIIAKAAKDMGALVVGIVTKPFIWEGAKRNKAAEEGIRKLKDSVDALISIPNQRLLEIIDNQTPFNEAFKKVDNVLLNATRGISDIISRHGTVNVDFADVKTVMSGMGDAIMGIGIATGENRAEKATLSALNSPLLDGVSIKGSKGVLVNVTGGDDMTMIEIGRAVALVEQEAGEDVNLIHGVVCEPSMKDQLMVTVVATGFNKDAEIAKNETETAQQEVKVSKNSNNNSIEIPYPINSTKTQIFPPTKPISSIFQGTANTKTSFFGERPRGEKELRQFDKPAFMRRGIELTSNLNELNDNDTYEMTEHETTQNNGTLNY